MAPEVLTAVQTELTTTDEQVDLINKASESNNLTKSPSLGDELISNDSKSSVISSSQIPVITSVEVKKKPYGGRPLRFQCPNCERRFHAPSHLKRHMLCHTSERPFQCHICNKGFLQAWHLGRHMTTHTGNKPFNCPECPKTFGSRFEMKTHCNYIHRGIKEHECTICKKMFTLRSNLKVHMRKHTGEKPYECHVCSKKFGQRGHLQYHLRKHEGEAEKAAAEKKQGTISEQDIIVDVENDDEQHLTVVNYDSGIESVSSDSNQQASLYRALSLKELKSSPPTSPTRTTSPVKRELKSTEIPLSGRMFDHTNPQELKPFVCVSCNCGFGEISSLRAHVRHSHFRKGIEEGNFSCAHCHKSYSEIDGLKSHFEEVHRRHSYVQSTSVISPPLSPSYQRQVGEKYRYSPHEMSREYEPNLKRSQSQILFEERKTSSPGSLSVSSDTTYDRPPYYRVMYPPTPTCPSDCKCELGSAPLPPLPPMDSREKDGDYVQSRYLRYLEQYQKLLESHVQLMEALQVCRK